MCFNIKVYIYRNLYNRRLFRSAYSDKSPENSHNTLSPYRGKKYGEAIFLMVPEVLLFPHDMPGIYAYMQQYHISVYMQFCQIKIKTAQLTEIHNR